MAVRPRCSSMTSPTFPDHTRTGLRARQRTLARSRLLLGVSAVGTCVLGAVTVLAWQLPARLLPTSLAQPVWEVATLTSLLLLLPALALTPFELIGGAILVRQRPTASQFFARWMRATLVQLVVWAIVAAVLTSAARAGGAAAAIAAFALLQLVLAALRARIGALVARWANRPSDAVRAAAIASQLSDRAVSVVETGDEGFVGGFGGIRAHHLWLPARWLGLPADQLNAVLARRVAIAESGAHARGVLLAALWNTVGVVTPAILLGRELGTVAGLITVSAWMTLWGFVSVLLLPTPSRWAVFSTDAAAARTVPINALCDAITQLDRWQDDEPARTRRIETIFHPVPARNERLRRLREGVPALPLTRLAHNLARHALFLNWAGMSPLSRAVHCNVGRPSLFVMLPGD